MTNHPSSDVQIRSFSRRKYCEILLVVKLNSDASCATIRNFLDFTFATQVFQQFADVSVIWWLRSVNVFCVDAMHSSFPGSTGSFSMCPRDCILYLSSFKEKWIKLKMPKWLLGNSEHLYFLLVSYFHFRLLWWMTGNRSTLHKLPSNENHLFSPSCESSLHFTRWWISWLKWWNGHRPKHYTYETMA